MPKRVLFISHSGGIGGAQTSLLELLERIDRNSYEPLAIVPQEGLFLRRLRELGIEGLLVDIPWWFAGERNRPHPIRSFLKGMAPRIARLRQVLRERRIDLVYTNTITCIDGGIAAWLQGIPHVWHIHEILRGNTSLQSFFPHGWERRIVDMFSAKVLVPSNAVRREIACKGNGGKVVVVENGIDLARFRAQRRFPPRDYRMELGIGRGEKVVGLVGYFHEVKGQADFIEAAGLVNDRRKDTVFVMAGSGSGGNAYSRRVAARASALGLDGRVRVLEFQEETADLLDSFDVLACASWVESFSRVTCEAMAAGKPVVATRCGGPEEIVVDGETGLLVPVRQPAEMARAICSLLDDEGRAEWMGLNGRRRVEERFTIERYVQTIEGVLDRVV